MDDGLIVVHSLLPGGRKGTNGQPDVLVYIGFFAASAARAAPTELYMCCLLRENLSYKELGAE